MELKQGKISNYVGQVKSEDKVKIDDHMVQIDKDLQNLWRVVNYISPMIGSSKAVIASNATIGFSYIPSINTTPTSTPTAYTGKSAICFCNSNSNLYIFNTSNNNWNTVHLT